MRIKNYLTSLLLAGITFVGMHSDALALDVYVWDHAPRAGFTEENVRAQLQNMKDHGVKGVFYHGSVSDLERTRVAARIAQEVGVEFHAWIPALAQMGNKEVGEDWFAVSREGHSARVKPAYVDYYQFLCPNREEVYEYFSKKYKEVAQMPGVKGVHLDYIRYPDVILARGLWAKYGLEMTEEFAPYDYCYCDLCTKEFQKKTGIDIKAKGDAAQHDEAWKSFRCDTVTELVNKIAADVHAEGKQISAAVFPGPSLSKKMVRQDWGKWDLDLVAPMIYNDFYLESPEWVGMMTAEGVRAKKPCTHFITGLFICGDPENKASAKDPENHGLLPSEIGRAVKAAQDAGAESISLFTFSSMTPAHWAEIKKIKNEEK